MIPLLRGTARLLFIIAALGAAAACSGDVNAPRAARKSAPASSYEIYDGAHNGGNDDVFFLPPMVANPTGATGYGDAFAPGLPVSMTLECLEKASGSACPPFSFPANAVTMDQTGQFYMVNWDTKSAGVDPGDKYRIHIFIGSVDEAHADVLLLSNGSGKNVATGDDIPLVDGRTLPIKVRIEQGWNCANNAQCVSQVVPNTPEDQPVTVITNDSSAAAQFSGNWIPYCQSGQTANCVPVGTQVIVTIEDQTPQLNASGVTCSLINDGAPKTHMLSQPAHCVKFTTDPEFTFAHSVKVAVCVETDDPTQQLLKYDFDETPIFLQNVAFDVNGTPFTELCKEPPPQIGSRSSNRVMNVALAAMSHAGRALRSLVVPTSAYAIHLGVGGLVDDGGGFSYVSPGHPLTMRAEAGNGQRANAGQAVANPVQVRITTMHSQPSASYASPVANLQVSCQIASGGGSLGAAGTAQALVTTDATGLATCPSWILGTNPGPNTLTVVAPGIDGGILAVEDGESSPDSIPMVASVSFSATGTSPLVLFGTNSADDGLSIVDPTNGARTFIGALGQNFQSPISMAARPSDGALFVWDNVAEGLVLVDKCTGQGSLVNSDAVGRGVFNELAFAADGTLYGLQQVPAQLVKIDPTTGLPINNPDVAADQAKPLTLNGNPAGAPGGAAFGPDGRLYAIGSGQLLIIDTNTGAMTVVANLNPNPPGAPLQAIAFDPSGNLFGTSLSEFFRINPATGAVSNEITASNGTPPQGMAFAPPCVSPIG